jgi:predicted ATP-dependent endonuclease of OLD family
MTNLIIGTIKIPSENYFFETEHTSKVISGLSRVNIFLGPNNSGKSRFLRELLKTKIEYLPTFFNLDEWNALIDSSIFEIKPIFSDYKNENFKDFGGIVNHLEGLKNLYYKENSKNFESTINKLFESLEKLINNKNSSSSYISYSDAGVKSKNIIDKNLVTHPIYNPNNIVSHDYEKIYIPILRGLININSLISDNIEITDIYHEYIKKTYFSESDVEIKIHSGLSSFFLIKEYLLGNRNQRKFIKDFENYLSSHFFDNKIIEIIPSEKDKVLVIKIGDEREQPISQLGDGIQSIINITLPLFLNKDKNVLFFIEEPEKYLHPGLQRKLIETFFISDFSNFQYFFTTHSNHFLDITIDHKDVSIFTIKKEFDKEIGEEKLPHFSIASLSNNDFSLLELLGIHNSSVLLANCTIWVEGITDRLYLRKFISVYQDFLEQGDIEIKKKRFNEDYHYCFVEYAGNNITHWSFLENETPTINVERLCGKLFLIVDKDKGKDKRHEKLMNNLGERFFVLPCLEIENILGASVVNKVISDYEGHDVNLFKNDKDLLTKKIGSLIESKLGETQERKGKYATNSGTITNKIDFCHKALNHINDWDDVSENAKNLTKKIFAFIESNNQ